jgi:hypothetical protein
MAWWGLCENRAGTSENTQLKDFVDFTFLTLICRRWRRGRSVSWGRSPSGASARLLILANLRERAY